MRAVSNGRARKRDRVRVLTDDIAAIRRDLAALIGEGADTAVSRARDTAELAKEQLQGAYSVLSRTTARRPVTTIAVSMVAGIAAVKLLGWALRR